MNRSELIEAVGSSAGVDKRVAERTVDAFVGTIMQEVKGGDKVTLTGFGTFNPTSRAARTGRNPQTGEPVKVKASKGVRFSPGTAFKGLLNPKAGSRTSSAKMSKPAKVAKASKSAPAKSAPAKSAPAKSASAVAGSRASTQALQAPAATKRASKMTAPAKSAKAAKAAKPAKGAPAKPAKGAPAKPAKGAPAKPAKSTRKAR